MSATINAMVEIDKLLPSQLEAGDIIKVNGDYVRVIRVSDTTNGYRVTIENEWNEGVSFDVPDARLIPIYMDI